MGPSWQSPQYSRREASPPATRPVWPAKVGAVSRVPWDLVEHLAEARQLRSSTDASSQGAPHHRTGLTDQRGDNRCHRTGRDRRCLRAAHRSGSRWNPCRARTVLEAAADALVDPLGREDRQGRHYLRDLTRRAGARPSARCHNRTVQPEYNGLSDCGRAQVSR